MSPFGPRNRRISDPPTSLWNQVDSPASAPAKRWYWNILPRRDGAGIATLVPDVESPLQESYRKGDIICLDYGTLDDAAMRRLEGRSDHRPIFGTYSICI